MSFFTSKKFINTKIANIKTIITNIIITIHKGVVNLLMLFSIFRVVIARSTNAVELGDANIPDILITYFLFIEILKSFQNENIL